ncbi:MAG: hypothetical protein JSS49_23760 [Planctomycetes bacterium]|nr:hypothetical protein [Planctomycetota bacterium]
MAIILIAIVAILIEVMRHNETITRSKTGFELDTQHQPLTALEERQRLLSHHVRLIAKKVSHALFVFGSQGGLGKSRTILRSLADEGIDPILINSHVTPLSLYSTLYLHREEAVIFFDDVDSMFGSMPHLGLLRSALWGSPRIVTYNSSQLPNGLPNSFEFTSQCIFAANVIPQKNDAFKAVLSRCDIFQLEATNEEVIELMRDIAAKGFNGISSDDAATVIDFIADRSGDRQLSLRLLGPSLRKFIYARSEGINWRPMIESQLQTLGKKTDISKRLDNKSKDMKAIRQVLSRFPDSQIDQLTNWCRMTGKSRASFYRTLKKITESE